jgi:cytochrome c-type biogenesis protein CcmH
MKFLSSFSAPLRETLLAIRAKARRTPSVIGCLALALAMPEVVIADSSMPAAPYANQQLPDPAQEKAAQALMMSVRCLVCQGQSIADSDADMASDMRAMIRKRIAAGEKPEDIRAWLIERYGNWVSYKPVFDRQTAPLWIAPLLLIGIGAQLARSRFKRRVG